MKNKPKAQSAPAEKRLKFFGLGKLKPYIKTYRVLFAVLIFGSVVASVLNTITPLFQQYAIDNFIANKTVDGLITFALLYASAILLCAVVDYFGSYACCATCAATRSTTCKRSPCRTSINTAWANFKPAS